jgi:hypothetical protein
MLILKGLTPAGGIRFCGSRVRQRTATLFFRRPSCKRRCFPHRLSWAASLIGFGLLVFGRVATAHIAKIAGLAQ